MKKWLVAAVAMASLSCGAAVFAQDTGAMSPHGAPAGAMHKDSMSKDAMQKDSMSKGAMTNDAMHKDSMAKGSQ